MIGIITNINTCMFYGAPLSTIYTVIKQRDSSSIHRPTMILNTSNAVFWVAFGIGVMDWIILIPNGLGAILGFIQMFLRLVVPARTSSVTVAESDFSEATTVPEESSSKAVDETKSDEVTADELIESGTAENQ